MDLGIELLRDLERLDAGISPVLLPHGVALVAAGLSGAGPATTVATASAAARRERLEQALLARQDVDLNLAPDAALERLLIACAPTRGPALGALRRG